MARIADTASYQHVFIRPRLPARLMQPLGPRTPSVVHRLALALTWLAIASGAIVFSEPAPTDVLTMGMIVLLPVVGLTAFRPPTLVLAAVLLSICGLGFIAALNATELGRPAMHMAISLYLSLAAVVIAGFVARQPIKHTRLIFRAHLAGALLAALAALIGYFDLLPGTKELFTKFDRASGPFKDPNVFGPFLVPAILYALHVWLNRPLLKGLPAAVALLLLSLAALLSFSRGAWAGTAIAVAIYLYVNFVTTRRALDRIRILTATLAVAIGGTGLLLVALQSDAVSHLLSQRASLAQSYDVGHEGRFGGQIKAFDVITEAPFGIGALEFPERFHHEDVHNVYLNVFLNSGWLGGLMFIGLAVVTLALGLSRSLQRTPYQGYLLIAYAALAATLLQGVLIDIDHWRHFHVLLGIVWALMLAPPARVTRSDRIVTDRRPKLLQPVILLPPSRRQPRILGPAAPLIELRSNPTRPLGPMRRPARLLGPFEPRRAPRIRRIASSVPPSIPRLRLDNLPP